MSVQTMASGLLTFLADRGWTIDQEIGPWVQYRGPEGAGLPNDYRLFVPRQPEVEDNLQAYERAAETAARIHGFDSTDLIAAMRDDATVLRARVLGPGTESGELPLDRFDALVDRLRRVCGAAAASVIEEDPLLEPDTDSARAFVARCSFMQTRVGSFQSRIKIPNSFALGPDLLTVGTPSLEATEKIRQALHLIFDDVIGRKAHIYQPGFVEELGQQLHYPLVRNVGWMLADTAFPQLEFGFVGVPTNDTIAPDRVTRRDVRGVQNFLAFMRDRLRAGVAISALGMITELRSTDVKSSNNHVRIRAYNKPDGKEVELAVSLGRASYLEALSAHGANKSVEVVGTARRLKSYLRVDDLRLFRVL